MHCGCLCAVAGTDDQRVLIASFQRLQPTTAMMVFDRKGRAVHANTQLASMLGYKLPVLLQKDITTLLPPPYGALHVNWIKARLAII